MLRVDELRHTFPELAKADRLEQTDLPKWAATEVPDLLQSSDVFGFRLSGYDGDGPEGVIAFDSKNSHILFSMLRRRLYKDDRPGYMQAKLEATYTEDAVGLPETVTFTASTSEEDLTAQHRRFVLTDYRLEPFPAEQVSLTTLGLPEAVGEPLARDATADSRWAIWALAITAIGTLLVFAKWNRTS